jgi:hypothetical protein
MDATDSCLIGQDKTKRGNVKNTTHIQHRWQNILTKLPGVTGQARNATTSFEAWNCLITDEILDNIVQHTNQYILLSNLTSAVKEMSNKQTKLR